ncbi:hypothetical protein D9M68_703680 [compost metagenome]
MVGVGHGRKEFVDAAAQALRQCFLATEALQGFEQAFERTLAILLTDQLLTQLQLIETAAEGQEIQRLAALHLSAEQAAQRQGQRSLQCQFAAGQRGVQQGHQHLVEGLLRFGL